eukprot:scaffold36_cov191-Ochromonas_danica.AAC.14
MTTKNTFSLAATAVVTTVVTATALYLGYRLYCQANPSKKYQVVFVLGGPGSGKGTNCSRIVQEFGYVHLSAGDLLRAERDTGSELATMINTYIKEGKIVPAEVTVRLLREAMDRSGNTRFLIDGFPHCPTEEMVQRLLERGKTSGRNDDNEEAIKKRLVTYEQSTRPIIEYFRSIGKVREVNSNRSLDDVYGEVAVHFNNAAHSH